MRLSIGAKLAAGFLITVLLSVVGSWWSYRALTVLQTRYDGLLDNTYSLALAAMDLNAEIQGQAQMVMAYAATREEDTITGVSGSRERVNQLVKRLQDAAQTDPDLATGVKALSEHRDRFNRMVNDLFVSGDELSGDQLILSAEQSRSVGENMARVVQGVVSKLQERVESERAAARAAVASAVRFMVASGVAGFTVGVLIIFLAQWLITRPIRQVARELSAIAQGAGDLTRQIKVRTGDELELLASSFNQMQRGLAGIVRQVIQGAADIVVGTREVGTSTRSVASAAAQVQQAMEQVAAGASTQVQSFVAATQTVHELVDAINQIAAGASQQAMQVQGTTQTVNSMVRSMEAVAEHASQVSGAAAVAAEAARKGAVTVDQTLEGMRRIREQVVNAVGRIEQLDGHSRRIGEIMQVITDIAGQTNLLALNAAIEAARAGEQGRGFAVVADEVRRLAERAAHSAQEIRTLIRNIQDGTTETVAAIRAGASEAEAGADLAATAGAALSEILETVERTTAGVQSISTAARDVLAGTHNVARAVEDVAAVTQENSASTEEMAAGADQVAQIIADVQRVSEHNSSAVEEVSASVAEVNGSMADIAASSQALAAVAERLQRMMGQFKVQ